MDGTRKSRLRANVNRGVLITLVAMALLLILSFVFFWVMEGSRDLRSRT
jgi:hypothetical protein